MGRYHSCWRAGLIVFLAVIVLPLIVESAELHGDQVKMGALIPLTGFASGYGQNQKVALDLAVDEINKAGGILGKKLKVITYDTECKGQKAILGFRRLVNQDQVLAVLGPFLSTECEVCFPLANKYKIVSVSASAAKPGLAAKHRPFGFVNATSDLDTLPAGIDFWKKHYGIKTAAIVTDIKDALNKATGKMVFPMLFKKKGIKVVGTSDFVTGEMDFSAHVTKLKGVNPAGIAVSCTLADAAGFVKEAKKQGLLKPLIGGVVVSGPTFLELAGRDANGMVTSASFWMGNPDPKSKAFVKEFQKRYGGRNPHPVSANMYENVYIMKKLVETTGITNKPDELATDRLKIQKGLSQLKDFHGVTGTFSITSEGTVKKPSYVLIVKDGRWIRP